MSESTFPCGILLTENSIAATMLLGITYGSELQGEHDPLFTLVETAVDIASGVAGAGSYLGNVLSRSALLFLH